MNKPQVLCVDDEESVLKGLEPLLRGDFDVYLATSAEEGLATLRSNEEIVAVLSDMRMPRMSGAEFLGRVRSEFPDAVRMLLTGYSDMEAAVSAVNEGQLFRFLTKPCPSGVVRSAFQAATEQHRLLTSERVLLEKTLRGSVAMLVEILSLANPAAYGRAMRVSALSRALAGALRLDESWEVEVATMLCDIGSITLPEQTIEKVYAGKTLDGDEERLVQELPKTAKTLIGHIPRLEPVLDILDALIERRRSGSEKNKSMGARVLQVAFDYDTLESKEYTPDLAVARMYAFSSQYDESVLGALKELKADVRRSPTGMDIPLSQLEPGMILAEEVRTRTGAVFVARGQEVTTGLVERIKNGRVSFAHDSVRVVFPDSSWQARFARQRFCA